MEYSKLKIRKHLTQIYISGISLGIFFISTYNSSSYKMLNSENFASYEMSINGIIDSKFCDKNSIQVQFINGDKYSLPFSKNLHYEKFELKEFLMPKDLIFKRNYSDTLFVKRDGVLYYFLFNKI